MSTSAIISQGRVDEVLKESNGDRLQSKKANVFHSVIPPEIKWEEDIVGYPTLCYGKKNQKNGMNVEERRVKGFLKDCLSFIYGNSSVTGIDLSNIVMAGDAICDLLIGNVPMQYDYYVYGIDDSEKFKDRVSIFFKDIVKNYKDLYMKDLPSGTTFPVFLHNNMLILSVGCYTFKVHLVKYPTRFSVLTHFTIGAKQVAFDDGMVLATPLALFAYENHLTIFNYVYLDDSDYDMELANYCEKGFDIVLPILDIEKVKNLSNFKLGSIECYLEKIVGNKIIVTRFDTGRTPFNDYTLKAVKKYNYLQACDDINKKCESQFIYYIENLGVALFITGIMSHDMSWKDVIDKEFMYGGTKGDEDFKLICRMLNVPIDIDCSLSTLKKKLIMRDLKIHKMIVKRGQNDHGNNYIIYKMDNWFAYYKLATPDAELAWYGKFHIEVYKDELNVRTIDITQKDGTVKTIYITNDDKQYMMIMKDNVGCDGTYVIFGRLINSVQVPLSIDDMHHLFSADRIGLGKCFIFDEKSQKMICSYDELKKLEANQKSPNAENVSPLVSTASKTEIVPMAMTITQDAYNFMIYGDGDTKYVFARWIDNKKTDLTLDDMLHLIKSGIVGPTNNTYIYDTKSWKKFNTLPELHNFIESL